MKAWQRIRREECEVEDRRMGLWGPWWEAVDTSLDRARVVEVDRSDAAPIVERYEWMRSMPAVTWHQFAATFDGNIGAVVVYGPEYSENLGVWDRYGYTGRMVLLARGVTLHWAHPHTASFLIRRSIRMLPSKYAVVTATVDPLAGEVGTVYQASGFDYVGSMDSHPRGQAGGWEIRGKTFTERSLRARFDGRFSAEDVQRAFPSAIERPQVPKGRYFAFRGTASQRRHDRAAIEHFIQPYPKRAVAASSDATVNQTGEGSSQLTLPLQFLVSTATAARFCG